MGIEALNCQYCGAPLNIESSVCECEYCGRVNIIGGNAGKYINQLNRANRLRQQYEFDQAFSIYDMILAENTPSVDILWSQALCEYGIEYVPDPVSSKHFPTLHRIKDESFENSRIFTEALELADEEQKVLLKNAGEEITKIQKKYLNIASNEKPYDVFICYKETDEQSGEKTEDVKLAEELYNELTGCGYKVFFARETLKNKLGIDYEPYIFAALKSSRAMAVIGTKAEYFTAVWVKNEWGRFLKLMQNNPDKMMFFACDNPEELPRAFATKQAQLLGKEGAIKNLAANIDKFLKNTGSGHNDDSDSVVNQEEYDRIISEKAQGYAEKISKTRFREEERSLMQDLWELDAYLSMTKKLYDISFHLGSVILIATNFNYFIYIIVRMNLSSDPKGFGPTYFFNLILLFSLAAGTASLLGAVLFLELFDFRRKQSPEIILSLIRPAVGILGFAFYLSIFIYVLYPVIDRIIICLIPLEILLVGYLGTSNRTFKSNVESYELAKVKFKNIENLEKSAKEEFLEYDAKQIEFLEQIGKELKNVEIKDYHYDVVKPVIKNIIDEDLKFQEIMSHHQLDVREYISTRKSITLIYTIIAVIISGTNLIFMLY